MKNRIWKFRKKTPKTEPKIFTISNPVSRSCYTPSGGSREALLDCYQKIIQDQCQLIDEKNEALDNMKRTITAQTTKIQKLIGYIERILGRKLNAKQEEKTQGE